MFIMTAESESTLATRPSLLARLKDWSQQSAWREFEHDYAPLLRNVARKAGLTNVEADDAVQEMLIAVAKKIGDFKHAGNRGSFRSWLYQQARWRIADRFRDRARYSGTINGSLESSDSIEPAKPQGMADPMFENIWDTEWEDHIRKSALERVKRHVGARQFQLFDLHAVQGLPAQAAAKAAGATIAAVFMAKSRVGRLVRKEIERLKLEP